MARQENLNGTGLGMFMAKMLMNKSQGDICVLAGKKLRKSDKYVSNIFTLKFKKT